MRYTGIVGAGVAGFVMLLLAACGSSDKPATAQNDDGRAPFTDILSRASCGPDDLVETGLQGQVSWPDRLSGRAAMGYHCNLKLIGRFQSASFANFDSYKNCVYYTDNRGGSGMAEGGGVVLDLSDPAHPVQTDYLTAVAMGNGGESLRVNQARGLLVTNHYNSFQTNPASVEYNRALAVYDVSKDCRHPELLADVIMPRAVGHEGCFHPDGMVYYMASTDNITPIDLSDPRNPVELSAPWPLTIHGCSISDDGSRGYFADLGIGGPGKLMVVDTSEAQARKPGAQPRIIASFPTPNQNVQQSTYPLLYQGRPYVFNWSEGTGTPGVCAAAPNFGYARILDLADEAHPIEVSRLLLEVHDPQHCMAMMADRGPQTAGTAQGDFFSQVAAALFIYDFHYCRPDRLHEPTIMACANFGSGLRVFDIRDPKRPREIAYYNTGTLGADNPVLDYAIAPPVIRRDLGQIWWVTMYRGLHVAQFREGVWPFAGDEACTADYDYFADQYDAGYCRSTW